MHVHVHVHTYTNMSHRHNFWDKAHTGVSWIVLAPQKGRVEHCLIVCKGEVVL
jgi:hypothetical protein